MKRMLALTFVLCLCLTLCGCNLWMDGSYYSMQPHRDDHSQQLNESATASSYVELKEVLEELIENGQQSSVIYMPGFQSSQLNGYMQRLSAAIKYENAVAAYAVNEIQYDIGTNSGKTAIAVDISYIHNRSEILKIRKVSDMESAVQIVENALDNCESGTVVHALAYEEVDFSSIVQNYVEEHPDVCMETPQVTAVEYPQNGKNRIIELTFTYQTNRDALREMQKYVEPVFEAAVLNVSGEETQNAKFALMYAFLMERNEYQLETSITPAYSLLRHGVGDSKAFATVYAAMCRRAGLDCRIVAGTKEGNPWFWNVICEDGIYYHIDLLSPVNEGKFLKLMPENMQSYVWDYSTYPESGTEQSQND